MASRICAPRPARSASVPSARRPRSAPGANAPATLSGRRAAESASSTIAATGPGCGDRPSGPAISIKESSSAAPSARRSAASRTASPPPTMPAGGRTGCLGRAETVSEKRPHPPAPGMRSPAIEIGVPAASASRKEVGDSRSRARRVLNAPSKAARSGRTTTRSTGRPSQASGGSPNRLWNAPAANSIRPSGDTSSSMSAAVRAKVRNRSRSLAARRPGAGAGLKTIATIRHSRPDAPLFLVARKLGRAHERRVNRRPQARSTASGLTKPRSFNRRARSQGPPS